jgi:putative heme transporter
MTLVVTSSDDTVDSDRPRIALVRWAVGLAIGGLSLWVAIAAAGGFSNTWAALRGLDLSWLFLAFVIEATSYVVLGAKLRRLIGMDVVGNVEAIELGLVVSGFGLLTPVSPAEGLAIAAGHLRHRGLTNRRIALVFALTSLFSVGVFLLVSSMNLLVVAAIERDSFRDLWPFVTAALVVLGLLGLMARMTATDSVFERFSVIAGSFRRPSHRRSLEERRASGAAWYREAREVVGSSRHRLSLALLTAGALLGDVACLWLVLRAAHANVGFDIALLAVTVAAVSIFVPLVPGGLGIVEAVIPAVVHHFGVDYGAGIAAALAYRALGTFIPAGIGALAIFGLRTHIR